MAECAEERFCRVADGHKMRLPHRLAVPSFLWFSRFSAPAIVPYGTHCFEKLDRSSSARRIPFRRECRRAPKVFQNDRGRQI